MPEGETDISTIPLGLVQEVSGIVLPVISIFDPPGSTVIFAEEVHPPASVTVTEKVPGSVMSIEEVVSPVFHIKSV